MRTGKVSHISELVSRYRNKLQDPRWQKLRLKRMELSDWKCDRCGNGSRELQVHHNWYLKDMEPWDYDVQQLATLCDNCHEIITDLQNEFKRRLSFATPCSQENAIAAIGDFPEIACELSRYGEGDYINARVAKCYGIAVKIRPILLFQLIRLHDHKGLLEVYSREKLDSHGIIAVREGWFQCDESQLEFYCGTDNYYTDSGMN